MPGEPLAWGRHYAMVDPSAYRIDYVINPYMDPACQPDPGRARAQWEALRSTLVSTGAVVDVIPAVQGVPDMVYAMNLGLVVRRRGPEGDGATVLMSHMRHAQRQPETPPARAWFAAQGMATLAPGADGIGPHFEAGDAFPFRGELFVGHGPRTDELALRGLADDLGVRVRGFRIAHPAMYHLDLAFCPLDDRHALVCPDAFDEDSAAAILDLVPDPVLLTVEEAVGGFVANSVVVGRTLVMPGCPAELRDRLEVLGFGVVVVDVAEFHLGGGSVRCLTNPLDITLGRDLDLTAGGRVLPPGAAAA